MEQLNKQSVIDEYNKVLCNINQANIKALEFGFIQSDCIAKVFAMLIHCVENIEIFDDRELNNIHIFINKINYGR